MAGGANRDFASFLDELISEEAEEAAARTVSLDYLSVADELHSGRINFSDRRAQAEYEANQKARKPQVSGAAKPEEEKVPSTDPDEIARELGLSGTAQPENLDRLRRDFAFSNHPDRVPSHLRAVAMIRMQLANMLIDEAKRSRVTTGRSG
ncbi:hypothetical protein NA8A_08844 [Nitratireductor indicus C115]|uniref:Uncharacterized protein n=1 Tax=Nitratireductor indicus C115 TaxID=1231190 RepID=K2PNW9_9HYPH|nr:hypothetical protein [Nitratireductor indicus]EKF42762.1 hypothetical protein NA8A_08844 [Nitratireductor indicus C115]SFQ39847.1 hypothetical protein SAMN05216176_103147 [Nitratireductor indicus]